MLSMPMRYFRNRLPDHVPGAPVPMRTRQLLSSCSSALRAVLAAPAGKPSVYTGGPGTDDPGSPEVSQVCCPCLSTCAQALPALAGAAGVAYALWHTARLASQLSPVVSEADLLAHAERYARSALQAVARQPPEQYGWSLLAGHAGVYCTGALVFDSAAALAERQGRSAAAEGLRGERAACVERYTALASLAAGSACQEDEVLYGRGGFLLGCLLLNGHLSAGAAAAGQQPVPREAQQAVVAAMIESGGQGRRRVVVGCRQWSCIMGWPGELSEGVPAPPSPSALSRGRQEPGCAPARPLRLPNAALLHVAARPRRLPLPWRSPRPDG